MGKSGSTWKDMRCNAKVRAYLRSAKWAFRTGLYHKMAGRSPPNRRHNTLTNNKHISVVKKSTHKVTHKRFGFGAKGLDVSGHQAAADFPGVAISSRGKALTIFIVSRLTVMTRWKSFNG